MENSTNNIIRVELAAFKEPENKSTLNKSTNIYNWGENNLYPEYLIDLIKRSVKHSAILNGKVKYVSGSGVESVGSIDVENNISNIDTFNELIRKVAYDFETFNAFALEVTLNASGGFGSINHIRVSNLRFDKDGQIWFCENWSDRNEERKKLKKYNQILKEGVFYFKEYSISQNIYPTPQYSGAISYIETDASIAKFRVNNIKNGFSAGTIVNFANGVPTEEEQEKVNKKFKKKFTGENNAGEIILTFSNGVEKAPQVISVTPNNFDKLFTDLDKACSENIFIGHSITSPLLMGVKTEGQLGGRTEIVEAHELFQLQYVDARQTAIEDVFNYLLSIYNTKINIKPLNTIKETLSESLLSSILTRNELRKIAGFEPIAEQQPTQMCSHEHDAILKALENSGSNDYKILKYGFACDSNEQALYFENKLKAQKFSTIPENDLKVLQYLKENQKASTKEISEALKMPLKNVYESVDALTKGGLISGEIGIEVEITTKGSDELTDVPMLEVETRYTYAVRPGVPSAKKSRDFCTKLMTLSSSGKTWSREEIESISNEQGTSAWKYRGGWYHNPSIDANTPYCRHEWKQVIVTKK